MWIVAGILLGLVVLAALVGFHSGPHTHVAAGILGLVAALWLVIMALDGHSAPALWALLSADLVVSAGVGVMGWFGLSSPATSRRRTSLEGEEGVALGELDPEGVVSVRGEHWSARSLNGKVRAGGRVQVVKAQGVRLEVWAEEPEVEPCPPGPELEPGRSKETGS